MTTGSNEFAMAAASSKLRFSDLPIFRRSWPANGVASTVTAMDPPARVSTLATPLEGPDLASRGPWTRAVTRVRPCDTDAAPSAPAGGTSWMAKSTWRSSSALLLSRRRPLAVSSSCLD